MLKWILFEFDYWFDERELTDDNQNLSHLVDNLNGILASRVTKIKTTLTLLQSWIDFEWGLANIAIHF